MKEQLTSAALTAIAANPYKRVFKLEHKGQKFTVSVFNTYAVVKYFEKGITHHFSIDL